MLIHDIADPIMEIAKLFFYSNYQAMANLAFAAFAFAFILTRDFIFPYYVVLTAVKDYLYVPGLTDEGNCPYFIFPLATLFVLQFLHLVWSGMIVKMVVETLHNNGVKGDIREDHDD